MKSKSIILLSLSTCYLLYSVWVYTLGTSSPAGCSEPSVSASRGKLVYQKYNCTACHQIYGLGGYLGPELTNVMADPVKAEILASSYLQYGSARMPNLHLRTDEIRDVIEYLKYVDMVASSGNYPGSPLAAK